MKIVREVSIYYKEKDDFLKSFVIDIPLNEIKEIFGEHMPDDPGYYAAYQVQEKEYKRLINYCPELSEYPLNTWDVFLQTFRLHEEQ